MHVQSTCATPTCNTGVCRSSAAILQHQQLTPATLPLKSQTHPAGTQQRATTNKVYHYKSRQPRNNKGGVHGHRYVQEFLLSKTGWCTQTSLLSRSCSLLSRSCSLAVFMLFMSCFHICSWQHMLSCTHIFLFTTGIHRCIHPCHTAVHTQNTTHSTTQKKHCSFSAAYNRRRLQLEL